MCAKFCIKRKSDMKVFQCIAGILPFFAKATIAAVQRSSSKYLAAN